MSRTHPKRKKGYSLFKSRAAEEGCKFLIPHYAIHLSRPATAREWVQCPDLPVENMEILEIRNAVSIGTVWLVICKRHRLLDIQAGFQSLARSLSLY